MNNKLGFFLQLKHTHTHEITRKCVLHNYQISKFYIRASMYCPQILCADYTYLAASNPSRTSTV